MAASQSSEPAVRYTVSQHVATITLNRPEYRNALSPEIIDGLVEALLRAEQDSDVRVLVLTGSGNTFCSGGNLKEIQEGVEQNRTPSDIVRWYKDGVHRIPLTIASLDKPLIAAVNGYALGAGCDLALMCDFRIAADSAKFGQLFVKVGLAPGDGGAYYLTRLVGLEKTLELVLTGDIIDAAEALRIGLVGRVVSTDALAAEVDTFAQKLAAGASQAQWLSKRAVYASLHQDLKAHLDMMAFVQALLDKTDDHREALAAFAAKREPVFKGR